LRVVYCATIVQVHDAFVLFSRFVITAVLKNLFFSEWKCNNTCWNLLACMLTIIWRLWMCC